MKIIVLILFLFTLGCDVNAMKPHGLIDYDDEMIWLYHSGSGVEFISTGGTITCTVAADESILKNDPRIHARVGVYADGERVVDTLIDQPEKIITLESDAGTVINIIKLSEGIMSGCGIRFTHSPSMIVPVADKEMFIEFIGDSITTGYGVDGSRDDRFTTATQDVTKTYAYKTAQTLDADFRIQAVSGSGVVSGSTTGAKMPHHVMPEYYDWENAGLRNPDIIIINLGTNDASYTRRDPLKEDEFTQAYVDFLTRLRSLHPDAFILCTLGIMGDTLYSAMEKAVISFGDENTAVFKFETQREADGYGSDWHPSETTHDKAAEALTRRIYEIIN